MTVPEWVLHNSNHKLINHHQPLVKSCIRQDRNISKVSKRNKNWISSRRGNY